MGGIEGALARSAGVPFAGYSAIFAGPLHGVGALRITASLSKLALGTAQALFQLLALRPRVILLTGGWANLPVALAAKALRIPIVIFLPDIEPGLTIKALNRFASAIALTAEASARFFPGRRTVLTGYPLLESRLRATRAAGLAHFSLDPGRKTLLVFGGSHGARSINIALVAALPPLLQAGLQILHITGELDWQRAQEQAGALTEHERYQAFAYLHTDMALAMAAADLALCRAGASTLAELPLFGLPAILAPYPHAWRYQRVNAEYLCQRGAAVHIRDEDLPQQLQHTVLALIRDEARLSAMRARSLALAQPDGADKLARLLIEVGGG